MIDINYHAIGTPTFRLRLRFFSKGETRYLAVTKRLKGAINKRHWNHKKQRFIHTAPFSEENNYIVFHISVH